MQKQFYPSLFSSPNGNSTETFKPQYRWSLGLLLSFFHFFPPPPVPLKIRKEYKIGRILYSCLLLLSSVTSWGRGHTIKWDWLARAVVTGRFHIFCAFHGLREPERRSRAESPRLSPLGHELALQEVVQRCFFVGYVTVVVEASFCSWAFVSAVGVSGAAGSSPGLWSDLINHSISCSAEADEIW